MFPDKVDDISTGTTAEALPEIFCWSDGKGRAFAVFVEGAVSFVAFA